MAIGISPLVDFAFKMLPGNERHGTEIGGLHVPVLCFSDEERPGLPGTSSDDLRILLLQELLGLPLSNSEELAACNADQLNNFAADLHRQFKARRP